MQTPSPEKTISTRWGPLAHVLAYNIFCFAIVFFMVFGKEFLLPSFAMLPLSLLLWLTMRPTSRVRPRLPEKPFSPAENRLWLSGAVVCALALLGCAYAAGVRDAMKLSPAFSLGVPGWVFLFLTVRDCRRITAGAAVPRLETTKPGTAPNDGTSTTIENSDCPTGPSRPSEDDTERSSSAGSKTEDSLARILKKHPRFLYFVAIGFGVLITSIFVAKFSVTGR
jgi:hypothetical protein